MITCLDKATILPTIQRMQDLERPGLDMLDAAVRTYIEVLEAEPDRFRREAVVVAIS